MTESIEYIGEATTFGSCGGQTVSMESEHIVRILPSDDCFNVMKMRAIKSFRAEFTDYVVNKVVVHYYLPTVTCNALNK